jgi:hypothetical protein
MRMSRPPRRLMGRESPVLGLRAIVTREASLEAAMSKGRIHGFYAGITVMLTAAVGWLDQPRNGSARFHSAGRPARYRHDR